MTTNNPFADRIRTAAQEGYVNSTRRNWKAEYAVREAGQERAAYQAKMDRDSFFANPVRLASAKQVALINNLLSEKELSVEQRPAYRARLNTLACDNQAIQDLSVQKASALIEYLFGLPAAFGAPAPQAHREVPAGHYALERDGEITFYSVDRPTEGRWAGKVFVSLLHGPDETSMSRQAGFTILGHIVDQGVMECLTRYGREIGKCGVCHRRLTNEESRRDGIGPICRERV